MEYNAVKPEGVFYKKTLLRSFLDLSNTMTPKNNLVIFLLLTTSCIFLPFLFFQYYGGSYVTFGNESLAYRYFTTLRLMSGEPAPIWLPQGYFTLGLQKLILLGQNLFISPYQSFQASLEWFGTLTNVVQNLLAIALLVMTFRDKYLSPYLKWIPLLFFVLIIYGAPTTTGFYYFLVPDYYQLDVILLASCISAYFCIATRNLDEISFPLIATIGFVSGLAIVNKISLIFPVMAPVLLLSISHVKQYQRVCVLLSIYASAAILGIFLPLLLLYFHHKYISANFTQWMSFLSSPGSESNFIENLKSIYLSGSNYFYFALSYLCIWILAFITIIKKNSVFSLRTLNAVILFCLTLLSVIIPLKVRTAGTTNFETFGSMTALTLMLLALIPTDSLLYRLKWLIPFFWLPLFHPVSQFESLIHISKNSKENSNIVWAAHKALLASKTSALMVLPDNSYGIGSVEELFIKGLSEFPTWNITTGKDLLDKLAPNLSIYNTYTKQKLKSNYASIMWIDKKEDEISLKETSPVLKKRLTQAYSCKQWPFNDGSRIIHVCTK